MTKKTLPQFVFGPLTSGWYLSENGVIVRTWSPRNHTEQSAADAAANIVHAEEKRRGVPQLPFYNQCPVRR